MWTVEVHQRRKPSTYRRWQSRARAEGNCRSPDEEECLVEEAVCQVEPKYQVLSGVTIVHRIV